MTTPPLYYCIAHAPFAWKLPDFVTIIGSGDYVPEQGLAMSELAPDKAMSNVYYGEYAVMFQIRRMLIANKTEGMVGASHYRRFALTRQFGDLRGFNYQAHPDLVPHMRDEDFIGDGQTPIVPVSTEFPFSVMLQYAAHCEGRDLLMFFGDAIDCGVISSMEATMFLTGKEFITATTCAYIPVEWFIDIMGDLEKVMARHYRHHYVQREGYHARAMAFCCERLHALLLARRIAAYGAERVNSRHLTLLSDIGSHIRPAA